MTPPAARQPGEGAIRPNVEALEQYANSHIDPLEGTVVESIDNLSMVYDYIRALEAERATVPALLAAAEVAARQEAYERGVRDMAHVFADGFPQFKSHIDRNADALIPGEQGAE